MCQFFGVSRSGYYDFCKRVNTPEPDAELAELLKGQQERCRQTYGYRRMWLWLEKQGIHHNPKTVLRVMKKYDCVALIHILRQPAGVGVQQTVYLLMVDGVHHPLLLLRDLGGLIHRLPVGCCGAPRHIVGEADHPFCPAGQFLIDGIIFDGSSPPGNENAVKRVPMNTLHSYRSGTFLFFCRPFATGGGSSSAGGVSERSRPRRLCRAPMFVAVISLTQYRSQGSSSAIRWVRTATSNAVSSSVETYTEQKHGAIHSSK
ncbi:IS3 family transposase [uncultured Oscillibacter sp.]|uniref:IS3 family transposase n=1 Tax=uncultured Oscillibacter sp. TaxID=876091 RepID=UPI00341B12E4